MDVAGWLRELGLERYESILRDHEIDWEVLPELTEADLEKLGMPLGPRKKLLRAIGRLSAEPEAASAEPTPAVRSVLPEAERRQLTMLFCDLVGSTELAARLDPEDMGEVIRSYQECCGAVVSRWNGHVAKYMGDGVLAYFGWPQAHEDDAERAVRAGLKLVEAVSGLHAPGSALGSEREERQPLAARVGIATGLVMVGDLVGEGAAQEERVIGETPNLAARLQALAAPGAVVIAEGTRRLLGGLFDLDDMGAQDLKGFADSTQAWRVLAESLAESRFEALHGQQLTRLVGREHELGLLAERWERAKEGEGQVVLLSGEPGIGKSRIVRALREQLAGEPHVALSYFSSPHHTNSALHVVIGQLERAARFAREDTPEIRLAKLERLIAKAAEGLDDALPLLAELLDIPAGDRHAPPNLSPQRRRQRTLEVLVDLLAGLTRERPVLEVYEDVHWSDPSTLELLDLLVERVARLPALVLITFRPEFSLPWGGQTHVTHLSLDRLDPPQSATLVERIASAQPLPVKLVETIVARADGVPLFVEELTKAVLESGLMRRAGDGDGVTDPVASFAVPSSLHDGLMARLDRLGPVKEVAQLGAVIGREFGRELLAAVAPLSDAELTAALDQLMQAQLVFRRGDSPSATYSFKHALVQDAAYQSLLRSRRQQLHAWIAAALEQRFHETAKTQPEVVAYHCTRAGLAAKAAEYWLRAARRASDRSANLEGIAHATRGLEMVPGIPDASERARLELDLQAVLGGFYLMTRGHTASEVGQAYSRVLKLCDELHDSERRLPALLGLARFHMVRGNFAKAKEYGEQLWALARETRDPAALIATHYTLGVASLQRGELLEARDHIGQGASLHKQLPLGAMPVGTAHHPGVACVAYLARPLWMLGYADQALAKSREAVNLAREMAHPFTLAFALYLAAQLLHHRREAFAAQEVAEEAIALTSEQGFPMWLPVAQAVRTWAVAVREGPQSTLEIREALVRRESMKAKYNDTYLLCLLAEVLTANGLSREALKVLEEALTVLRRLGEHVWEAELLRLKGVLLSSATPGGSAEIEACLRRAIEVAIAQSAKSLELRATTSLARLWADQGERQKACDLLAPVYDWFTEGFDTPDLRDAKALLDALR